MSSGSSRRDDEEGRHLTSRDEKRFQSHRKGFYMDRSGCQECPDCPKRLQRIHKISH